MKICDRSYRRGQKVEPAKHVLDIDGGEQVFHLCDEELSQVMTFILKPTEPDKPKRPRGRPRKPA